MKKIILLIAFIASCIWANCEKQVKAAEIDGRSLSRVLCHESNREVLISLYMQAELVEHYVMMAGFPAQQVQVRVLGMVELQDKGYSERKSFVVRVDNRSPLYYIKGITNNKRRQS